MLNLPSPSTSLQVVTGSAVTAIAVFASFNELAIASQQITNSDSQSTLIDIAGTVQVVDPPGAGVNRNVKFLSVNNSSLFTCAVTVQTFDGVVAIPIFGPAPLLLGPGWSVHYNTDGNGFVVYDNTGAIQMSMNYMV
jgi:hypothetical protein